MNSPYLCVAVVPSVCFCISDAATNTYLNVLCVISWVGSQEHKKEMETMVQTNNSQTIGACYSFKK